MKINNMGTLEEMKHLVNINVGIEINAKNYLKLKVDPESLPLVHANAGTMNSIKLHKYKLKDGSMAEEYIQMVMTNEHGQNLYFLALKTNKRYFEWPAEKILKKMKLNYN